MPTARLLRALIKPTRSRPDLADQHHPDDLHRLRRGDPEAAAKLRRDAEPGQHRRDLGPAAVHHDRVDAAALHEHDVGREGALEVVVDHGVAAILDHHGLARVGLQPGQRLGEDRGLLDQGQPAFGGGSRGVVARLAERPIRCRTGSRAHVEYSAFSLT